MLYLYTEVPVFLGKDARMCKDDMNQENEYRDSLSNESGSTPTTSDPPTNRFEEEAKHAREASRRLKRRMLIVVAVMVTFAIVAIPLINLIDKRLNGEEESRPVKPDKPDSVIFFTPDYEVNILEDPDYLELDRSFRLTQGLSTTTIDTAKINSYSPAIKVLYELVNALIMGDAEAYNSLFSERYYQDEKNPPIEEPFTMQRIYEIVIIKHRERSVTDEESGKYNEYIYEVEYKISRNDGTYRTDIGHDSARSQYFQLTDREGTVRIDRLMYMMD